MTEAKKTLGIIGGMGAKASEVFYGKITDATKAEKDQDHINILLWSHASIPDRTQSILSGREEQLWAVFEQDVKMLRQAGCDYLAIPCNTSHYFQPRFEKAMDGNFISMIDESAAYASSHLGRKIGILATDGTVQGGMYKKALERCGSACVYPSASSQEIIMHIIYDEIKKGKQGSLSEFMKVVNEMKEAGCDGVILACTELSVLKVNYPELSDSYYLDAMDVLAKTCIEKCGGIYQGSL